MSESGAVTSNTASPKLRAAVKAAEPGDLIHRTLKKLGPTTYNPGSLVALLGSEARDTGAIVAAIKICPSLTSRLLGVINSAAFGLSRKIDSVERATVLLGPARSRSIAMAYGLRLLVEAVELPKNVIDLIWDNSLRKACAAFRLCDMHQPDMADAAYCAGLIQDIGLPMLMAADLDYYQDHIAVMTHRVAWTNHEREHFGFDHCSVGQGLLQEWGAADPLQQLVLDHHLTPVQAELDDSNLMPLASFFAGLIPHLDEDPAPETTDWINAIHARFLMTEYPSPDQFFVEIADHVFKIQSRQAQQDFHETDRLVRHLTRQVTNNMMSMTAKLSYLEQRDRQQQEGITTLKFQAFTDGLTHVLNRRGFTQLGERRLRAAVERGTGVCCMLGDLDDFKSMNDNYGHDIGDMVLRGLVKLLRRRLNETDLIGRIGGDEFAIFVTDITEQDARELAKRLVGSIQDRSVRVRDDLEVTMSFSLGALYSDKGLENTSIDDLLRMADQLMYDKKRSGKNGMQFTSKEIEPPQEITTKNPQTLTRREDRPK